MDYENMPLRGKISINAWEREHNCDSWGENTRRNGRKFHRHYDLYKDWWKTGFDVAWSWKGVSPSKGKKRKTWKDYKYGAVF